MKEILLKIDKLTYSYDKQNVLENVNLEVIQNDFLAIIGPNGGGKSTLLRLILGLNKIKSGSINFFKKDSNKYIGYVPQNTNINIDFPIKVIDVVLMGIKTKNNNLWKKIIDVGYSKDEIDIAHNVLKQVGMSQYMDKKIGSLSGGQRQRVMIARALCNNPKILILDEPTASIDVEGQKQIYDLLKVLNNSITIIVVSHDISVILSYASKVAHINKKLVLHDISSKKQIDTTQEHFCEVEMLQMLGSCKC